MINITNKTLVVVADGGGAILFRNEGAPGEVHLHEDRRLSADDIEENGPSGSRPEDQTPKQTGEATFAKHLTQQLNKMSQAGKLESLIVIADPQTLGQMRSVMTKGVEGAVLLSLSKDLTNHSTSDIAEAIKKAM